MRTCLTLVLLALFCSATMAADWPAFRGPDRTGISTEKGLLKTWPAGGPKLLWQSDKAGKGYAGLAVVGGVVYTMGARGSDEFLMALDDKGAEKWSLKMGPVLDWDANSWSRGPNATPTVDGDLVYGLSSKGMLVCAERTTGKEKWQLDLSGKMKGAVNDVGGGATGFGWGYSWSPVVDGDNLIILPGGKGGLMAALDKKSGKELWRSTAVTEEATYSSPMPATIGGTKQYIALTQKSLVGISARDGSLLWKHTREEPYDDIVCQTPIVRDNQVYISVGKAGGSDLFKLSGAGGKFKVEPVWQNKVLNNYFSGVVLVGGHLYGYHEANNWVCQDLKSGELVWPKKRMRQTVKMGGMVVAEDRLYVLDDQSKVGMIEASPMGYKVISSFDLPKKSSEKKSQGGVWTHPSLSDGKLYLRDQELVFCYQVK